MATLTEQTILRAEKRRNGGPYEGTYPVRGYGVWSRPPKGEELGGTHNVGVQVGFVGEGFYDESHPSCVLLTTDVVGNGGHRVIGHETLLTPAAARKLAARLNDLADSIETPLTLLDE